MMDAREPPDSAGPDPLGGAGATRPSGRAKLAELRLFAHALRQGWTVPNAVKDAAVERVDAILKNAKSERSWLAAARTAVAMTQATVASIDCAVRVRQSEDLADRMAEVERVLAEQASQTHQAGPGRISRPAVVFREDKVREEPTEPIRGGGAAPPEPPAAPADRPPGPVATDPEGEPDSYYERWD